MVPSFLPSRFFLPLERSEGIKDSFTWRGGWQRESNINLIGKSESDYLMLSLKIFFQLCFIKSKGIITFFFILLKRNNMGSFGRGNPIIWDIILWNLFILLVYQRVFTFARLNPDYYYFFGRNISPGQLILYINTSRCRVTRFKKKEKASKPQARFVLRFIRGSPTPAQGTRKGLFRGKMMCSTSGTSWPVPYLPPGNHVLRRKLRSSTRPGWAEQGWQPPAQRLVQKLFR